ncbi:MAG: hypothetical protein A3F92_06410 [Candidatus Rokubacteria bacterium RIFCSPLOWO2_12_FULL_71_22]|nr:MAG: hypothetical protein A3F92_06410 [Candidatus Rokubacteria bacterium RIFCSPLOWO2_12_FULL_71_22]
MRTALVLALATALAGCSLITLDLTPRIRPLEEEVVEGGGRAKILLLDVSGFLADEDLSPGLALGAQPPRVPLLARVREELKKAAGDSDVRALVVRVNSPGGTVTAADVLYRELGEWRRETKRPIVAVMMDVAASGGYYLALAADTIVAHPTSVTGSIGVIMVSVNAEGLMQKLGLATAAIKSGERKDMGSPFRPLTDEERRIFQSVIDELHGRFVAKVVERRGIPAAEVASLADGRIYTAEQALERRLIDRIGYMPDAIAAARTAAGLDEAKVIVYRRPSQYRATYYARAEAPPTALDAALGRFAALAGTGPKLLYLWWP